MKTNWLHTGTSTPIVTHCIAECDELLCRFVTFWVITEC